MDLRDFTKNSVALQAEIISEGKIYVCIVKNFSEQEVFVETVPMHNVAEFIPDKRLLLKFELATGDMLHHDCEAVWLYTKKISPSGLKQNNIGMKISSPPQKLWKYLQENP